MMACRALPASPPSGDTSVTGPAPACWSRTTWRLFLQLVAGYWGLLLVQSLVLLPLLQSDPLLKDLPASVSLMKTFWTMRLVAMAATPVVVGMRVLALSLFLHGVLTWCNRGARVGDLGRRILRAESIFLLEAACTTLVLVLTWPGTLLEAESLHLRAGIDLLWQPESAQAAAWVGAANIFVVWWADCIRRAVRGTYGVGHVGALGVAIGLALALVTLRSLVLTA
jgi:hypothetical protein